MIVNRYAKWESLSICFIDKIGDKYISIYKQKGIYGIKNKVNEKVYVGKTEVNFGDRWDCHKAKLRNNKHDNQHLQHSYNKYSMENFEFYIIHLCDENYSSENYNELEKKYIKELKEKKLCYNISDGGDGALGCTLSEETKRKIGEKNRINGLGRKPSEETKKKMSESQKKRKHTPESIEKMKNTHKGKIITQETREKISKTLQENPTRQIHSKETILNIRIDKEQNGLINKEIAKKYSVDPSYVSAIVNYKRWVNLKP